jgi:hypothetical protein
MRLLRRGTGIGAAYGTAKSGIGIAGVGTFRSDLIMKVRKQEDVGPHRWWSMSDKANKRSLSFQSSCLVLLLCTPLWLQSSLPET